MKSLLVQFLFHQWTAFASYFLLSLLYLVMTVALIVGAQDVCRFGYGMAGWFGYEVHALWAMALVLAFHGYLYQRNPFAVPAAIFIVVSVLSQGIGFDFFWIALLFLAKFIACAVESEGFSRGRAVLNQLFLHSVAGMLAMLCTAGMIFTLIVLDEFDMAPDTLSTKHGQEGIIQLVAFGGGFWYFGWLAVVETLQGLVFRLRSRVAGETVESDAAGDGNAA